MRLEQLRKFTKSLRQYRQLLAEVSSRDILNRNQERHPLYIAVRWDSGNLHICWTRQKILFESCVQSFKLYCSNRLTEINAVANCENKNRVRNVYSWNKCLFFYKESALSDRQFGITQNFTVIFFNLAIHRLEPTDLDLVVSNPDPCRPIASL